MKGNLKEKNGITLIALVITIIVMLILVAVTIGLAIKGGLFTHAGKATSDIKNAQVQENELSKGRVKIDGIWYDSIDDYINERPSSNQEETGIVAGKRASKTAEYTDADEKTAVIPRRIYHIW